MSYRKSLFPLTCAAMVLGAGTLFAQTDPGPRGGPAGAGGKISTLNSNESGYFTQAQGRFGEVDSVSGGIAGEAGAGLGPTFNGNSCAMCHAQPAMGGSSPGMTSKQNPVPNPQVALATLDGAHNTVPSFITANGPVREARFISSGNGITSALDGGVHGIYTIAGRTDATGCTLAQPNFATQLANHNVIFRIPTPTFGLGLVENTADSALQANLAANASQKAQMGIGGRLNTSGNDGSVTRFGWKAQNKSLLIFAGEAYNVEQGVSNEIFPNERSAVAGCIYNPTPEDPTNIVNPDDGTLLGSASRMSSDTLNFAIFMRLLAPPTPATASASELHGQTLFSTVGCALCHSPTLTTAQYSQYTGVANMTYHPYSDFAVHHMGSTLADGINQGAAGPDEFRTAPLWGVGQRLFFMHDGRAGDLLTAIAAHSSPAGDCVESETFQLFKSNNTSFQPLTQSFTCGSEANKVVAAFTALSSSDKQDILNFLRSL